MTWLTGWSRRKQLYINGSSATQSSYQMKITINYSGTDSAGNISCGGNCKTDFSDIRFTDSTGNTLLYYWIDSYVASSSAIVWVKIPSILTGSNSTYIYLYYGNSTPPSDGYNSGTNTFPTLFDDFSSGFTKWTHEAGCTYGGGNAGVTTSAPASTTNPAMYVQRTDASCGSGATTPLATLYGGWHFRLYKTSGTQTGAGIIIDIDYSRYYTLYLLAEGTVNFYGPTGLIGSATGVSAGAWHNIDITRDSTGYWIIYIDDVSRITGTNNTYTTNTKLGIRTTSWPSGSTDYADNVFYRSYVASPPTWSSSISSEQTLISLTINSTPSTARIWLAFPSGTSYVDKGVNTNNTISNLEPGSYDIKLVLSGYTDWILTNQNYTTNQTINATFAGSVYITSSPTGASVYLDGSPTPLGTTALTATGLTSTTSGATSVHTYRLTYTGCPDATGSFTATAGQTISVPVTFAGYLYISSSPTGARIWLAHPTGTAYVDQGVNTNYTLTKEIGTYDIKLVKSGYNDWISTNKTVSSCSTTNVPATLVVTCGTPSCNLIVMSMVLKQLSGKPPGYLDLDMISICIDNIIGRYQDEYMEQLLELGYPYEEALRLINLMN